MKVKTTVNGGSKGSGCNITMTHCYDNAVNSGCYDYDVYYSNCPAA